MTRHQLPRSTTQGEPDLGQHRPEPGTTAPIALGQARDLLGEDASWAVRLDAEEATDTQLDRHLAATHAAIGQPPLVAAVNPTGQMPAHRAGRFRRPRRGLESHHPARTHDAL